MLKGNLTENMTHDTEVLPRAVPPKNVLVADDASDMTQMLDKILSRFGHNVETCADGRDALNRFKPGKYDLVITDYAMPKMNGIELAHIIKKRDPAQLIIMVTGFAFTIAAYDMRPVPADFILRKPFDVKQLNDALTTLFSTGKTPAPADASIQISPSAN
jgi:CheY-like chemotaxis protein